MGSFGENLRIYRHNSIFVRLILLLNILVILCLSGLGYAVYSFARQNVVDMVSEANLLLTSQTRADIERELESLERLTMQLSLEGNVKSAVSTSLNNVHARYINAYAIGSINSLRASNEQVLDIWVHLRKTSAILTDSARYDEEYFFDDLIQYVDSPNFDAAFIGFPKLVFFGQQDIIKYGQRGEVLTFARAIPLDTLSQSGIVGLNVDIGRFRGILDSLNKNSHSFFYILNEDGSSVVKDSLAGGTRPDDTLVSQLWRDVSQQSRADGYRFENIGGHSYLVTHCFSDKYGWSYFAVTPMEVINRNITPVQTVTMIALVICITVSFFLSFLIVRRLYNPILQLVTLLRSMASPAFANAQGSSRRDEFTFIGSIIDYTYREYNLLHSLYNKNLPVLRGECLDSLLTSKLQADEISARCEEVGLRFPFGEFMAVTISLEHAGEHHRLHKGDRTFQIRCGELVKELYGSEFVFHVICKDSETYACVINYEPENLILQHIRECIHSIQRLMKDEYGIMASVGIGSGYSNLLDLHFSFIDSLTALKFSEIRGPGCIVHIDEIKELSGRTFTYSVETETQLINCIKTGDTVRQREIVDGIFEEAGADAMAPELAQNFVYALIGTAVRTIYDIRLNITDIFPDESDLYQRISCKSGVAGSREAILEMFAAISGYLSAGRRTQDERLLERITSAVAETEGRATLAEIAEMVDLSYNYLSGIFKEITGEGFVDYISRYRVERARILLTETTHSIGEIANKVGFISSNTFIKVFKKYMDVTPGKYREMNRR